MTSGDAGWEKSSDTDPHLFLTSPSRYGRPSSAAVSCATGRDPSGTGTITSICHPLFLRTR